MNEPKKPKSEATRKKILDAALERFRERGFADTTMREIATAAGVAVGLAYYYYSSKEEIVLAFYDQAREEMFPLVVESLKRPRKFDDRMRAILQVKFSYFLPNRRFLGALLGHSADPENPLSPFSEQTSAIREADIGHFEAALLGSSLKVPDDLQHYLPRLLWLYQMGLVLFWIYDRSEGQSRTNLLMEKSLKIVSALIRLSSVPLLKPARKLAVDLLKDVFTLPEEVSKPLRQ